jgi:hypothetical protein
MKTDDLGKQIHLLQKRFEEGWDVESLKNICRLLQLQPYDVVCYGGLELIKALGILDMAYNIHQSQMPATEIAHLRRVLRVKHGLVFNL